VPQSNKCSGINQACVGRRQQEGGAVTEEVKMEVQAETGGEYQNKRIARIS
jgi:hypothetical protein